MAELLKNMFFKRTFFENLSDEIIKIYPSFDKKKFLKLVFNNEWENKELKQRMRHASHALNKVLPSDYKDSLGILMKASAKFCGFDAMIFSDYVEVYGIEHLQESIPALELFTQLCSSEFAVRPFIIKYPDIMIPQMIKWSKHKNEHVRRLSSEGCRPRLPWAMALPVFKKNPAPIMPIIEALINDRSEYVSRSVANNLNDISKDNCQIVLKFAKKWYGKNPETDKVIKHACRGLLKQGNPEALKLFGFKCCDGITVKTFTVKPSSVKIGEKVQVTLIIENENIKPVKLRFEIGVYYLKSKGNHSRKVFKVSENVYKDKIITIQRMLSFENKTVRKHLPGKHKISLIINGIEMAEKSFILK